MASFNRVILLGNVTRDLEIKYLQSGMAVTEVGLAVNDRRKDRDIEEPEHACGSTPVFIGQGIRARHRVMQACGRLARQLTVGAGAKESI